MNDIMEEKLASAEKVLVKAKENWAAIKENFLPVLTTLQKEFDVEPNFSASFTTIDLMVWGDRKKLVGVMKVLRAANFTIDGERPKAGETTWTGYWSHPNWNTKIWMYFSSTACRRVKVGEEWVKQDKYEIKCEEETT